MDDADLIQEFLSGDQRAFDRLVLIHQGNVRRLMFRATASYDDAEDLAQEVFIKVYRKLEQFRGSSSFSTWLYRLSVNVLNSHFRRQKFRGWLGLHESAEPISADDPPDSSQINDLLARQLAKLATRERQVMILRALQDLNVADTARILRTSENAVKVSYHTARAKLRGLLKDE